MADIDIAGLVADGHLDAEALFKRASWGREECVATYVACCFGADGAQPGVVEVYIETTEEYGVEAWRWVEEGSCKTSPPYFSEAEAVRAATEYAAEQDETPDINEQIAGILDTGFFGRCTTAADIRRVVNAMSSYSQGVLLLARGEVPPTPIGVAWTTSGWLECDHIQAPADCASDGIAASKLLAAIEGHEAGE